MRNHKHCSECNAVERNVFLQHTNMRGPHVRAQPSKQVHIQHVYDDMVVCAWRSSLAVCVELAV